MRNDKKSLLKRKLHKISEISVPYIEIGWLNNLNAEIPLYNDYSNWSLKGGKDYIPAIISFLPIH